MSIFKLTVLVIFSGITSWGQETPLMLDRENVPQIPPSTDTNYIDEEQNNASVKKSAPAPIKLDTSLPTPSALSIFHARKSPFPEAEILLKQGQLGDFYKLIDTERKKIQPQLLEEITEESFERMLWIFYYHAVAPSFKIDDEGNTWNFNYGGSIDLKCKSNIVLAFYLVFPDHIAKEGKEIHIKRKELSDLISMYYARIVRTFHDIYDPDIAKKISKLSKEDSKFSLGKKWTDHQNKKAIMGNRSDYAFGELEIGEERFVKTIVTLHPGKAVDVKKYLKQAGYTDKEIPDLIDLTVGRDSKTEFLYKGRKEKKSPRK